MEFWGEVSMNKRLRLPLALALALGSAQAMGLGLGQIEVKSGLNEPLQAEIPVVGTAGETEALAVRLASPDAFARVGLDRPATLAANLAFDVAKDTRGRTVIRVSTPGDVVEPFLTFLLEVDWGRGRMLREYTVLLDSPTMAPIQGAPAATTPVVDSEPMQAEPMQADAPPPPSLPEPVATPAPVDRIDDTPPAPAPIPAPSAAPAYASDSYGPVSSGETLWSIASRTRPDSSISVNQMMVALLRANPDAFIGNNINRLRSGAVLRIPGREDAQAIAAAEAAAQVRDQTQTWRDAVQPAPQPATSDTYTGLVEPATTRSTAGADSRLELTPPSGDDGAGSATQSGASAGGEGRELRADLARSREEAGALAQENVELKSRVGELEKMQSDSARLIELKDSELANAQRRLAELEAQSGVAPSATTATPAATDSAMPPSDYLEGTADTPPATDDAAVAALDPATDAAAGTDPAADPADAVTPTMGFETPAEGDQPPVLDDPAPATPVASEPAAPATPPAAEPMPERPPQQAWYTNPLFLGAGGLILVGLIAALLLRRRRAAAAPAASRYDSDALAASVAAAQAGAVPVVASNEEREGELIEAISLDPTDLQRHLDLVRHYYDTGDAAGFESAAEAMYSRVYDPEDDAWQEVVALGQEIAPEHPLFVSTAALDTDPSAYEAPSSYETQPYGTAPADGEPPAFELPPYEPSKYEAPASSASTTAEREIVWDMPASTTDAQRPVDLDVPPATPALDDFTYDGATDAYPADLGDADDSASDAAATKLELARAYLDMGDVEGARGMLEEVLNEGSAAQRNDARRLLDEIR